MIRWLVVAVIAAASLVIVASVVANHAVALQVGGAAGGAVFATGGAALGAVQWPRRATSEASRALAAFGFLGCCVGLFTMLAGAGLYH